MITPVRFLALLLLFALPLSARAQAVLDARTGVHDGGRTRVVFDVLPGTRYSITVSNAPPQMVVEFAGARWQGKAEPAPPAAASGAVSLQRKDSAQGQTFTVLFRAPPRVENAFVLPGQGGKPARLVIDAVPDAAATPAVARRPEASPAAPPEKAPMPIRAAMAEPAVPRTPARQRTKPLIVLDPGHGGKDPGAIGRRTKKYEKDVVLQISKDLRDALLATGRYRVHMTRETDIFIPLRDRPAIAQKLKADLFLSVHADAALNPAALGASIYTLSKNASDRVAARLAAQENRSDMVAGVPLEDKVDAVTKSVLLDLMQRDTMNMSSLLADIIAANLRKSIPTRPNPHGYAGFMVLLAPDVPSALLETGFMSNPREEVLLTQRHHRQKIVRAVVKSIDEFFQRTQMVNR